MSRMPARRLLPPEVLFSDRAVLVVNKPAGLLAIPDRFDKSRENLMGWLHRAVAASHPWAVEHGLSYVANAHRLDLDTSGVFLVAKSRAALGEIAGQFRRREVVKSYVAIVHGAPPRSPMTVDAPIGPHPRRPGLARAGRAGRPSETGLEVVRRFRGYSLVRASPLTGRLHQVRVHLAAAGCPVLGDEDYGRGGALYLSDLKRGYKPSGEAERPLFARVALHAESLTFRSPATGGCMTVSAAMPKDMALALKYLEKYALAGRGVSS